MARYTSWRGYGVLRAFRKPEPIQEQQEVFSGGSNSSPVDKTIPTGVGSITCNGLIVVDVRKVGNIRASGAKSLVNLVVLICDNQLATDFSLTWVKANDDFIIRNEDPKKNLGSPWRFYGGAIDQETPDPVITRYLDEEDRTAWPGFVYIVFEDFDIAPYGNEIPLFKFRVSSSVTVVSPTEEFSTLSFGAVDPDQSGYTPACVDPVKRLQYLLAQDDENDGTISVIDIDSNTEISRATVNASENWGYIEHPVALPGSDLIVSTVFNPVYELALVDPFTGEVVTRLEALLDDGLDAYEPLPKTAVLIESLDATRYLVVCSFLSSGSVEAAYLSVALVDVTNRTLSWVMHPYLNAGAGTGFASLVSAYAVAVGKVEEGVADIYWTERPDGSNYSINKARVSKTGFTSEVFYTFAAPSTNIGVAYDSTDDTVVISTSTNFIKVNQAGTAIYTVAASITDLSVGVYNSVDFFGLSYRARAGYAYAIKSHDIYLIDLGTGSIGTVLTTISNYNYGYWFADQFEQIVTVDYTSANQINKITLGDATPDLVDLADIMQALALHNGQNVSGDLAFTGFPGSECYGAIYETDTSIADAIRTLADPFDVSVVESDAKLKFRYPRRDGSYALDATITQASLKDAGDHTVEKTILHEHEALYECTVSFLDHDADGEKSTATFTRPVGVFDLTKSRNRREVNLPLYMTAAQAEELAALVVYRSVYATEPYVFGLGPELSYLEPGDIVQFPFEDFTVVGQIKEATLRADYSQDLIVHQYLQDHDATYNGTPRQIVPASGDDIATQFTYLDTPLLEIYHDQGGASLVQYAHMTGYGETWSGGALYRLNDEYRPIRIGYLANVAPVFGIITAVSGTPADPFSPDYENTLTVNVTSGDVDELVSVTQSEWLAGANMAAVGRPGRWVLVCWQNVSASGGIVTLSNIVWGIRGSEVWLDDLAAGDFFVPIVQGEYLRFTNALTTLDGDVLYKAAHPSIDITATLIQKHTALGVAETPYAPVNVDAAIDGSDIDITWDWRSRLNHLGILTGAADTVHGEDELSFEVDIMSGGSPNTVLRTLTAATNEVTYTAAQISADFGSMPATLTVRVYMISAVVGRGYVAEATITL